MKGLSMFAAVAALSSSAFAQEAVKIEISVSKEGVVSLAGRSFTLDELTKELAALVKKEKISEIVILADEGAPLNATPPYWMRVGKMDSTESGFGPAKEWNISSAR